MEERFLLIKDYNLKMNMESKAGFTQTGTKRGSGYVCLAKGDLVHLIQDDYVKYTATVSRNYKSEESIRLAWFDEYRGKGISKSWLVEHDYINSRSHKNWDRTHKPLYNEIQKYGTRSENEDNPPFL